MSQMKANMKFRVVRFVSSRELVLIALHRKFTCKHAHEWLFAVHRVRRRKDKTQCFSATRNSRRLTGPSRTDSNCSLCDPSRRTARCAFLQPCPVCPIFLLASFGQNLSSLIMPPIFLSLLAGVVASHPHRRGQEPESAEQCRRRVVARLALLLDSCGL